MAFSYEWTVHKPVVEKLARNTKRKIERAIDVFDHVVGELEDCALESYKEDGLELFMTSVNGVSVSFIIDHPVKLVHIVNVVN